MKKIIRFVFVVLFLAAAAGAWIFLASGTGFLASKEYLYIGTNAANRQAVLDSLVAHHIIRNKTAFSFLADRFNYWQNIKPGKYEIKKGSSLLTIVRLLRNGQQVPVKLVITKLRTKEDFARLTGARFEFDSAQMIRFLNSNDSLKNYDADTTTAMWILLPDTYTFFWNTTPSTVYAKLYAESKKFWTEERKKEAAALELSPLQAYTLASIVEEETNNNEEKDTIASVYLNRIKIGMALGADPTIKFALRNFSIKWIHGDMLNIASPYNTYRTKGLPPGPICTPAKRTIEEVLHAPPTTYMYFVANSAFNGTHLFSSSFTEHLQKAKAYQAEDKRRRELKEKSPVPAN